MTRSRAVWGGLAVAALGLLCVAAPVAAVPVAAAPVAAAPVVAAPIVAAPVVAAPVPAAPPLMAIQNAMTGRCLASNGSTIYTTSSCRGRASLWYTVPDGGGPAYAVTSYASGFRLRIHPASNDIVRGRGLDRWYSVFNGRYDVIRNYGTGLVLESDFAGDVHARPADGGLFQQWRWIVQ